MEKVQKSVKRSLSFKKPGEVLLISDFRSLGTDVAVRKSLSRLAKEGTIMRLTSGVYYKPKVDPILGPIRPSAERVVEVLAKKEKIKVKPAGAYAVHKLGLTTQVPTKLTYITDGSPRLLKIGKQSVVLKSTTAKKLSLKGQYSSLLIQALEEIGTENLPAETEKRIQEILVLEKPADLNHDLELATGKIHDYLIKAIK